MKFSAQFEFHKIPEWYDDYLQYKRLKQLLSKFSSRIESQQAYKLNGLYFLSSTDRKAIRIDRVLMSRLNGLGKITSDFKVHITDQENSQRIEQVDNHSEQLQQQEYYIEENEKADIEKYTRWIANLARQNWDIADSYFDTQIPQGISLKQMPNYDRLQVEHMKLNTIDENYRLYSESEMGAYLQAFLLEIDRIEKFYLDMHSKLRQEYQDLQHRMNIKKGINIAQQAIQNTTLLDDSQHRNTVVTLESHEAPLIEKENTQNNNKIKKGKKDTHMEGQKITKVKDELEYATNWRRAVNRVFTHLKWLNSYAKINYIATAKIIEKFMKTFFNLTDNIIDKKLMEYLDSKQFSKRQIVNSQINELVQYFADNFAEGKREKAMNLLEQHQSPMRRKDALILTYFAGLLTMIFVLSLFLIIIPEDGQTFSREDALTEVLASLYTFRFLFMLIFMTLSASFCVKTFRDYKINYMFIMELDPHFKMTHIQLLRVSVILLSIWSFCFMGQLFITKMDNLFIVPIAAFTLAAFVIMVAMCLIPFHAFYFTARLEMLKVLIEVFMSPFTAVTFKHFIVADILTSFVNPLKDLGATGCFFFNGLWRDSTVPAAQDEQVCPGLMTYGFIVMFIPFWIRFAQSIRRYRDNKLSWNLVNAAKYVSIMIFTSLFVAYETIQSQTLLYVYIIYGVFNSIFCLGWDFYMDWGLLRSYEPGRRFLRMQKLNYPKWCYYFSLVANVILRFLWIFQVLNLNQDPQLILFILGTGEAFRRTMWSLLRIENENVNNFEKYRTILQIPTYREEYEEQVLKK